MAKVSIIIPNYNHSLYLKKRIDSIINQTFKDFELIILDDCSIDVSRQIIEQYRNCKHVSAILYNEINSGSTFKQWKKGIELAKGKYVWIAESDDYSDEEFLEKVIRIFTTYKEVGIVKTFSNLVDENDNFLTFGELDNKIISPMNGKIFIKNYMLIKNELFNASSIVFRKDLVESSMFDDRFLNMKYCGDWLFWIRVLYKTNIYILDSKFNYYRRHSNNVSKVSEKNGLHFSEGYQVYLFQKALFPYLRVLFNKSDRAWARVYNNLSEENRNRLFHTHIKQSISMLCLVMFYKLKSGLQVFK